MKNKIARIMMLALMSLVVVMCLAGCGNSAGGSSSSIEIEEAKAPALGISPSVVTVQQGEEFTVDIAIKTDVEISAAGCQVEWTGSGEIECIDKVDEGDFFSQSIEQTMMLGGKYESLNGTTEQVGVFRIGEAGVTGEGTLVKFHFKANAPGEVNLHVFDAQIADNDSLELEGITLCDGKVIVE
jgi:hypothetical protein